MESGKDQPAKAFDSAFKGEFTRVVGRKESQEAKKEARDQVDKRGNEVASRQALLKRPSAER